MRQFLNDTEWGEPVDIPAPRVVGYLAYDVGQYLEKSSVLDSRMDGDEVALARYDACITFDMHNGQRWLTANSEEALDQLISILGQPTQEHEPAVACGPIDGTTSPNEYAHQVSQVREWIAKGDVYQVNISHRFDVPLPATANPAVLYTNLRSRYPAPFGAYFDTGSLQILSNSPECFLRLNLDPAHPTVATWPLKGTRPNSVSPVELRNDPKDQAEHVMIVDLERNDLGRVARVGSVRVDELLDIVSYATVHHLESRIEATLKPTVDLVDVLQATFPGGSITGAPKIRAMQIIADIEREARGVYCGALGAIAYGGLSSVWNIPIRTGVISGGNLRFRVGGGVVMDSDPVGEYNETITKAKAFLDVLENPTS